MAWNVTEVVATAGERDWDSLTQFEGDHDGDATVDGTDCVAQVRGAVSNRVYWSGWQSGMDADTRIIIEATAGNECNGQAGSNDDARISDAGNNTLINESTNPIVMVWRDVELYSSDTYVGLYWTPSNSGSKCYIIRCLFRNFLDGLKLDDDGDVYIGGNIFLNCGNVSIHHHAIQIVSANATLTIFNTTIVDSSGNGIIQTNGTCTAKNCAIGSCNTDIGGTVSETTNKSEDDGDITMDDSDDFTKPSTYDYHVYNTDSALYQSGTVLADSWFTTLCSVDFDGTSWDGSNPSVGAYEYQAAGGPVAITSDSINADSSVTDSVLSALRELGIDNVDSSTQIENVIAQVIRAIAEDDIQAATTVGEAIIVAIRGISETDISSLSQVTEAIIAATRELGIDDVNSLTQVGEATLSVLRELGVDDVSSLTSVSDATISALRELAINDPQSASEITDALISVLRDLTTTDISSASQITEVLVNTARSLTPDALSSLTQISEVALQAIRAISETDVTSSTEVGDSTITRTRELGLSALSSLTSIGTSILTLIRSIASTSVSVITQVTNAIVILIQNVALTSIQVFTSVTEVTVSTVAAVSAAPYYFQFTMGTSY